MRLRLRGASVAGLGRFRRPESWKMAAIRLRLRLQIPALHDVPSWARPSFVSSQSGLGGRKRSWRKKFWGIQQGRGEDFIRWATFIYALFFNLFILLLPTLQSTTLDRLDNMTPATQIHEISEATTKQNEGDIHYYGWRVVLAACLGVMAGFGSLFVYTFVPFS